MIDERIIELYRSLLAAANEEKGMLYAQIKALTEEVSMLRQSMDQSKQSIDNLLSEIKSLGKKLEEKDNRIADLEQQLYDAHEQAKLDKKKRFVRSSEQDKERIWCSGNENGKGEQVGTDMNLKVCQNIGSEIAAENASFMFSLMESLS